MLPLLDTADKQNRRRENQRNQSNPEGSVLCWSNSGSVSIGTFPYSTSLIPEENSNETRQQVDTQYSEVGMESLSLCEGQVRQSELKKEEEEEEPGTKI